MNLYLHVLWAAVLLMAPSWAWAQSSSIRFEILTGSTYTYYPSGEGPGIEGCSPSDYQCEFSISGAFTLQRDGVGSASITDANLSLTGNEGVTGPGLITAEGVEEWLEGQELFNIITIATMTGYQGTTLPFESEPLLLTFETPGTAGSLSGGYDGRPVDGDAVQFQAMLQRVPLSPVLRGDCNYDGVVDFSDIPAFISILQTDFYVAEADCNQDNDVDSSDIPAFIVILIAG